MSLFYQECVTFFLGYSHRRYRESDLLRSDPCAKPNYSGREWAFILIISHKYNMILIEQSALDALKSQWLTLNMVDLVILSINVDSKFLYDSALKTLATSGDILTFEDAQRIGIKAMHDLHVLATQRNRGLFGYFVRSVITSQGERIYAS